MTAAEIVDRIKQTLAAAGVTWATETVYTFKAGKPETPVTGKPLPEPETRML